MQTGGSLEKLVPLCVSLSPYGLTDICLPNVCSSTSMSIDFLLFEFPNHYPQRLLLSIVKGEGFSRIGKLLGLLGCLPCICVIKHLFDFLL